MDWLAGGRLIWTHFIIAWKILLQTGKKLVNIKANSACSMEFSSTLSFQHFYRMLLSGIFVSLMATVEIELDKAFDSLLAWNPLLCQSPGGVHSLAQHWLQLWHLHLSFSIHEACAPLDIAGETSTFQAREPSAQLRVSQSFTPSDYCRSILRPSTTL